MKRNPRRESILNQVRIRLMTFDHEGVPEKAPEGEAARDTLLAMAAITILAIEEMDARNASD